jgi:hypothetical protein
MHAYNLAKKDMYKQFSLLILQDRNRHVIKERFLRTSKKQQKKKNRAIETMREIEREREK